MKPVVSVICPVYNEQAYIGQVIGFFLGAAPEAKELFLIDGGSTDGTLEVIARYQAEHPNIHLLHNEQRYVPYALNLAIPRCSGRYIARLDAHAEYPPDYFEACIEASEASGADNVGGYIHSEGRGAVGMAIAAAMSSPFGVGNASFRTRVTDAFVETVPFGFWKREAFGRFGLFDEQLIRNQDDEFNYRTIRMGGRIYQSARIHSRYFVRDSFRALFRQYYQYGYYKPLVLKKVGQVVKARHLAPACFVVYLFTLPAALPFSWWLIPIGLYLLLAIYFTIKSQSPTPAKVLVPVAFFILHLGYGLGFLLGLPALWRK
ncbi:MAG: glycosyltransferase family 2 protein [Phaeodactylibacter sp.]|nr:glycosyltransferase family 2 protein [Phaeodactylibacter sp.]